MDEASEDWEKAWSAAPHRQLLGISKLDFAARFKLDLGDVVSIAITEAPVEYADNLYVEDNQCPICGESTLDNGRICISVNPVFAKIPNLAFGAWAHPLCIESCPIIDDPTPIPW